MEIIKLIGIEDKEESKKTFNILKEYIKQENKNQDINYKDILKAMLELLKNEKKKKSFMSQINTFIDKQGGIENFDKKIKIESHNRCIEKCNKRFI